ncbi:hypothetical protein IJ00_05085 [Calothrix sp. 336/3]|nr:hypothetical protein IJ00_05085 [Calothrix sp. 336/3]
MTDFVVCYPAARKIKSDSLDGTRDILIYKLLTDGNLNLFYFENFVTPDIASLGRNDKTPLLIMDKVYLCNIKVQN